MSLSKILSLPEGTSKLQDFRTSRLGRFRRLHIVKDYFDALLTLEAISMPTSIPI